MKKERFKELTGSNVVIRFNEKNHGYFVNNETNLVINFSYKHNVSTIHTFQENAPRITLKVISSEHLKKDIPLIKINKDTLIMVNSNQEYEYALTFNLQIDEINRKVKVKIHDFPELGQGLITKEEIDGIELDIPMNAFLLVE